METENMRVGIFTSARSDFGLLQPIIEAIHKHDSIELVLFVSGTHLSEAYGKTLREIEYPVSHVSEIVMAHDTPSAITKSIGLAIIQYGEVLKEFGPLDCMLLLGDRYETLGMALCCHIYNICIAHIAGGEITVGSLDNGYRNCITCLSHLHFVFADEYGDRVIQMGENPDMVHNIGLLSLVGMDNDVECFPPFRSDIIVVVHPPSPWIDNLLDVLNEYGDSMIFFQSNMDAGGRKIWTKIKEFCAWKPKAIAYENLSRELFLDNLKGVRFIIGNSSAGIYEAPALGTPTINIGDRQKGRLQASSIYNCNGDTEQIRNIVNHLMTFEVCNMDKIPFQKKDSVGIIIEKLLNFKPYQKEFNDVA